MLEGAPDAAGISEAAQAFGLVVAAPEPDVCEVWAEHWPALRIFGAMRTQWLEGFSGPTGLNYAVLPLVERRLGISPRKARRAFDFLQVMEAEALRWFMEQR